MPEQRRFTRVTKPVTDLVIVNAETTGTVLQRQNAFTAEFIAASVDQVKVLTEAGSLRDAVDAQRAYIREISEKFQSTARENIETIRAGGSKAGQIVRGVFRRAESDVSESIDDAREQAAESVEKVAEAVAPAPAAPAQPQF